MLNIVSENDFWQSLHLNRFNFFWSEARTYDPYLAKGRGDLQAGHMETSLRKEASYKVLLLNQKDIFSFLTN